MLTGAKAAVCFGRYVGGPFSSLFASSSQKLRPNYISPPCLTTNNGGGMLGTAQGPHWSLTVKGSQWWKNGSFKTFLKRVLLHRT